MPYYRNRRRNRPAALLSFPVDRVLQVSAAVVRTHGWVSKAESERTGSPATSTRVKDILIRATPLEVTEADVQTAASARLWASDQTGSEYAQKIATLAGEDTRNVNDLELGLAASIIGCYFQDLQRQAEHADREARRPHMRHVGTVGQRGEFTLHLRSVRSVLTRYGLSFLYKFEAQDGSEVAWFSSRDLDIPTGATYRVLATVKRHGEFQGMPTTQINRAKILAEVIKAA